jgi:hypothetical protein
MFCSLFKGITRVLLNNRDHLELVNWLSIGKINFYIHCLISGTWLKSINEQKRLFVVHRDILFTFLVYLEIFVMFMDREIMGQVGGSNRKWKHVKVLNVCILFLVIPSVILANLSSSAMGMYYFINILVMCLSVICIVCITIVNYLLLTVDSIDIFMFKGDYFHMTKFLLLTLNGIYATFFESFSLTRLMISIYSGCFAIILNHTIQVENKQRQVSISKIESLLKFNFHSFMQTRMRKTILEEYNEGQLVWNQIEFEAAQNEK